MRVLTHRELIMGQVAWYYGAAWRRPNTGETVLIVIPFNFVAAFFRQFYLRLLAGPRNRLEREIEERLEIEQSKGFDVGYNVGYKDGYERAWKMVERQAAIAGITILAEEEAADDAAP